MQISEGDNTLHNLHTCNSSYHTQPHPIIVKYHKIPIISPQGLYLFKRLFCWAYFQGSLFSEGLIIGGNFAFQNGLDLTTKTASSNSPWAYVREGLLSEGYLRLRFGELIFGRAYYRSFTVYFIIYVSSN